MPTNYANSAWANDRAVCPPYKAYFGFTSSSSSNINEFIPLATNAPTPITTAPPTTAGATVIPATVAKPVASVPPTAANVELVAAAPLNAAIAVPVLAVTPIADVIPTAVGIAAVSTAVATAILPQFLAVNSAAQLMPD
ncbi:MAG: hypothetical protein NTW85_10180 [Methylococcales bacterium]|nr:hypothetical protein [Methylococcales bacterium]